MNPVRQRLLLLLSGLLALPAFAQTGPGPVPAAAPDLQVREAWVRGTVKGQRMSGAFMRLDSAAGATLLAVTVDPAVAGVAELHESKREGGVARMQAVARIALPPGQAVSLQPGGYHVMLMDLKQPLVEGGRITLHLQVEQAGRTHQVEVQAPVRKVGATAGAAGHGAMGGHGAPQ